MKSWSTKNNYQIIRVLSGRSNAYLLEKDDTVILVDASKKSDLKTLSQNLNALNHGKEITLDLVQKEYIKYHQL